MTETVPPWLATMRELTGTAEAPGAADNPDILRWPAYIGSKYPEMAAYAANYTHDSIPWCGLTVAYCMAKNGIKPVFGEGDLNRFLWADAWSRWGKQLDRPILGCVMVFTRNGGGHVALYEGQTNTHFIVRGGNQANAVNVLQIPKHQFTAAVWPEIVPAAKPIPKVAKPLTESLRRKMANTILHAEGRWENKHLVVYRLPANDGGGTYD